MQHLLLHNLMTLTVWVNLFRLTIRFQIRRLDSLRRGSFANSTFLSLFLRPVLEKDRIKALIGAPLMAAMIVGGATQLPDSETVLASWDIEQPAQEVLVYELEAPQVQDETTYLLPVEELTGVSQFYHGGHPGIDLRAPLESNVVSMENGKVKQIAHSRFGYGRRVYLEHSPELITMYSHLGLITVEEGEEVDAGEKVGEIGMTGWSTGPHLHFEVYENGVQTNPMLYLKKSIASYQRELAAAQSLK